MSQVKWLLVNRSSHDYENILKVYAPESGTYPISLDPGDDLTAVIAPLEGAITMIYSNVARSSLYHCKEMTFTAELGLVAPLSTLQLYLFDEGFGFYRAAFFGRVEVCPEGEPLYTKLGTYRVTNPDLDATLKVSKIFNRGNLGLGSFGRNVVAERPPLGLNGVTTGGQDFPPTAATFNPNYDTFRAVFERLAKLTDEAVYRYGLDPLGRLWFASVGGSHLFRKGEPDPGITYAPGTEPNPQLVVNRLEQEATEFCNAVTWLVAAGTFETYFGALNVEFEKGDTLTHTSRANAYTYERGKTLSVPSDIYPFKQLTGAGASYSFGGFEPAEKKSYSEAGSQDATFDLGRVGDADPKSYVDLTPNFNGDRLIRLRYDLPDGTLVKDVVGVSVRLKLSEDQRFSDYETKPKTRFRARLRSDRGITESDQELYNLGELDEFASFVTVGDRGRELYSSGGDEAAHYLELDLYLDPLGGGQDTPTIAVEDFRVYGLDTETLDRAAKDEYKLPEAGVSVEEAGPPVMAGSYSVKTNSDFNLENDYEGLVVEEIHTVIGAEEGVKTTYHFGASRLTGTTP